MAMVGVVVLNVTLFGARPSEGLGRTVYRSEVVVQVN